MYRLHTILSCATLWVLQCLGEGINCEGSSACGLASFDNAADTLLIQGLRNGIRHSTLDNSTIYQSGDHVICVGSDLKINFNLGAGYSGGGASVTTGVSWGGKVLTGGICVFPQNLESPLTLGEIKQLADALLKHQCKSCGSIPVHYVDEGNNDPGQGILTVNYVNDPLCIENCISAANDNDGSSSNNAAATAGTSTTSASTASSSASVASATSASSSPAASGSDGQAGSVVGGCLWVFGLAMSFLLA
ncbi:hypothetical protein LTR17_008233 [Elasticomyces elasticus]|nr:hypothetical protein LTR17_008233 [Elasticomyces elasticus]